MVNEALKGPLTISTDDECWAAYWGLSRGDLKPLIQQLETGSDRLHPLVQREMAKMLRGTHPKLRLDKKRPHRGRPETRGVVEARLDREVLDFLDNHTGSRTTAIYDAVTKFRERMGLLGEARDSRAIQRAETRAKKLKATIRRRIADDKTRT